MKIFDGNGMKRMVAQCQMHMAIIYYYIDQDEKALEFSKSAQDIFKDEKITPDVATCNAIIADIYKKNDQYEKAIEFYELARNIFDKEGLANGCASCNMNMADAYYKLGEYEKAIELNQSAKKVYEEGGVQEVVAECDMSIGEIYDKLGKNEKAIEFYESAKNFFNNKSIDAMVAMCNERMAVSHIKLCQYIKAIELFESAKRVFEENDMRIELGHCSKNIANVYVEVYMHDKAIENYNIARNIFASKDMQKEIAECDMHLAIIFDKIGKKRKALELYESTINTFLRIGENKELASCYMKKARIHIEYGQYNLAQDLLNSSRNIFRDLEIDQESAMCDAYLASIHMNQGEYQKALKLFESARKKLEKKGLLKEMANCEMSIADIYLKFANYDKALYIYDNVSKFFNKNNMEIKFAICLVNIANIYISIHEYENVLSLIDQAKKIFKKHDKYRDIARCDQIIAIMYEGLDDYKESIKYYETSKKAFKKIDMYKDAAICDLNLASVFFKLGKNEEAFKIYKKVNKEYDHFLELKWKSLWGIGNYYNKIGSFDKAKEYYSQSINIVEEIRSDVPYQDLRISFLSYVYRLYHLMIEVCYKKKDFSDALEYVERLKSRNLFEMIRNRDLMPMNATEEEKVDYRDLQLQINSCLIKIKNEKEHSKAFDLIDKLNELDRKRTEMIKYLQLNDTEFDPDFKYNITYSDIKSIVNEDVALIELFPTKEKTIIFIIVANRNLEETTIEIEYNIFDLFSDIRNLLGKYTELIETKGSLSKDNKRKDWEKCLDNIMTVLYNKLFMEIHEYVKKCRKIVFIPYSGFHFLPLHAMFTIKNGQRKYILDKYIISYAPSAKIYKQCLERKRKKKKETVVAFANPTGSPKLLYSLYEAKEISRIFGTDYIDKATRDDIVIKGKKANIIHYTGHANFNSLSLHKKNEIGIDSFRIDEIFVELDIQKAYLVTLSACETGIIQTGIVDEYIGLPASFLFAGTPTIVSSLWSVDDKSTILLMWKMYNLIREGKGKAEALTLAQRWLKNPKNKNDFCKKLGDTGDIQWIGCDPPDADDLDFSSPYYWAGFICSGAD